MSDFEMVAEQKAPPLQVKVDSARDPAFRSDVIVGIIKAKGEVDVALASMGVPWDIYKQCVDHPEWTKELERITHQMVVQPMLAAGKAAVMDKVVQEGNGYSLKMLYDTAPKEKLNEDDANYLDSMSGAPRNVLLREANKLHAEMAKLIESLEGGGKPAKQITEQIVSEVTARPKKAKKAK